jgi:hypothetical protein
MRNYQILEEKYETHSEFYPMFKDEDIMEDFDYFTVFVEGEPTHEMYSDAGGAINKIETDFATQPVKPTFVPHITNVH